MPVNIFLPQVTRIPITGPAPFNTLVCVSAEAFSGAGELRDGKLKRFPQRIITPFRLAGFDQRVPPPFDHSTTAWISSTGPTSDGNWLIAVDSVSGAGFSPIDGTYFIDLNGARLIDGTAPGTCLAFGPGGGICFYFPRFQVTSWVLCYEPPIVPPPSGQIHGLNDLVKQGISPADLVRNPTESTGRTTTAEETRRFLQQSGMPIAFSPSGIEVGPTTTGGQCACCGNGCCTCGRGSGGIVHRDGTSTAPLILGGSKEWSTGRSQG